MRILIDNHIYEFTVTQDDDAVSSAAATSFSLFDDVFQIEVRYRKYHAPSRSPEIDLRESLRLPRTTSSVVDSSIGPLMADILQKFEIPARAISDMAVHFKFFIESLSRRSSRRRGAIPVNVNVNVKVIPAERAAEIQSRMEAGRRESRRQASAAMTTEVAPVPAKKSAVEALERERLKGDVEERECAICLEGFRVGAEVIKMPCLHVYHKDCITRWLERTHFCPFCRFKLPC